MEKNLTQHLASSEPSRYIAYAENPIIQTRFTADPAPMVYGDTVYLYTSHDEDNADWFVMNDWRCYSSKDMVNWTDHGSPLSYKDFCWAKGDCWAGQCIERDGKFYWYVPIHPVEGDFAIGVAVSDSPTGPFKDPIGRPLVEGGIGYIDPTVFIDNDGQAYLYWGNPNCYYVKLNKDMISYDESVGVVPVPMTEEVFGKREGDPLRNTLYEEGPWFYRRGDLYYLAYSASGIPETLAYSTSLNPTGPWIYRGIIMPNHLPGLAFTNQLGIIDFKGHSYMFYHDEGLPGGHGFDRSVCLVEFTYNEDGSIPTIMPSKQGPAAVGFLNPFEETKAATIAWESGVRTYESKDIGVYVSDIDNGDYIKVKAVDFGDNGAGSFFAKVASAEANGFIELHVDTMDGDSIGCLAVSDTGGLDKWSEKSIGITPTTGVHDLYFVFKGKPGVQLFNFATWRFEN